MMKWYYVGYSSKYNRMVVYNIREVTVNSWFEINTYYKKSEVLICLDRDKFESGVKPSKIEAIKDVLNRNIPIQQKQVFIRYLARFYPEELL